MNFIIASYIWILWLHFTFKFYCCLDCLLNMSLHYDCLLNIKFMIAPWKWNWWWPPKYHVYDCLLIYYCLLAGITSKIAFLKHLYECFPGNRNKGKGNGAGLAWESTTLQTSTVNFTHTLLVQTHNMITVKDTAEQCCQL